MIATITTWLNLVTTNGVQKALPWEKLFEHFARPVPFSGDREHPGWSAARFDPCERGAANVRGVTALVLDYDGSQGIEGAAELWAPYYGLIHTTRKHAPDTHRFRVILPFGREVTPEEYAGIWRRIFARAGGKLDPAPKDPSRFWFMPGTPNAEHYRTIRLSGQPMDPDEILREPDPEPAPVVRRDFKPDNAEQRASAYIAKMPPAISGQGGHGALWAAALAAVQGFGLSEHAAFGLLWAEYNPRCQPKWSEREIRHKVRDAANRSKVPAGYKLAEGRDWTPPVRSPLPSPPATDAAPEHDPAEEWDRGCDGPTPVATPEPQPEQTAVQRYGVRSLADIAQGVYRRATSSKPERGVRCGHETVDRLIGGFRRGRVTVLGASTSWGKSSFAVMVTDLGIRDDRRILLVSGEDTEDTYGQRIVARRAGINAIALRDSTLSNRDTERLTLLMASLGDQERRPFFLNGIGKNAEWLAAAIGHIVQEEGIELVIVDYLQAFGCAKKAQDRRNEITHIARVFTDAIKASNAAGLIFSQLKRLEDGHRPTMHDLKESGDVENMAEHVLIGYAVMPGKGQAGPKQRYLLIEKNKDGPVLDQPIQMAFDEVTASFREQREERYEAQPHYYADN